VWLGQFVSNRTQLEGKNMSKFVAYHGVTAAAHQDHFNTLPAQGYRVVSLSVSGAPDDARYAAIWFERPGAAWQASHGLNASQYQQRFDDLVSQGYAPVLVSATGAANDAIFAAVFEQGITSPWYARHGLVWDDNAADGSEL
jgi:hypothetical protein